MGANQGCKLCWARLCVSRELIREGVDILKLVVSGESAVPHAGPETTPMSEAEVASVAETAHCHGKRLSAHAKSAESIACCIRHGVSLIYHANCADQKAMDMLEANKDWLFVCPVIAFSVVGSYEVSHLYTEKQIQASGVREELETAIHVTSELKKRGVRILGGGDYGFSLIPHGQNARDIEHFVRYLGFTPMEAILSMTKYAGEAMNLSEPVGQVRPRFLADLLLVNGNPLADPKILTDRSNLIAIMKDGKFHKKPSPSISDS